MLSWCSVCVRLCARGLPSFVRRPWLRSCPAYSAAGSSRHSRLLWPQEVKCASSTPGRVRR